jgi:hydrogenase expression/formation protein HypE
MSRDGDSEVITLGHGSGGRLTNDLIRQVFLPHLSNPSLDVLGDAAWLPRVEGRLAMTTDGFVVSPREFPGGDIGCLAIYGTVNDLAVGGAVPLALSAAFVLEEGLSIAELRRVAASMGAAALRCDVEVVTGDTKVVERGHGDGLYIVTAGVGRLRSEPPTGPSTVCLGDEVVVSGPVGDHGAIIAALRNGLDPGALTSDCGPVLPLVDALYGAGIRPRFLRDPTRGGLATVLAEFAKEAGVTVELREADVPVRDEVRAVCDLLGLDPLFLACEGRVVAVVPGGQGDAAVAAFAVLPEGRGAAVAGRIVPREAGPVALATRYGGRRLYDTPTSEPLPRIC